MDSSLGRIAEDVLFSVLMTAAAGWTAASMADAAGPVTSPAACFAAHSMGPVGRS